MKNQLFISEKTLSAIFFEKKFRSNYFFLILVASNFTKINHINMAKSKKQQRIAAREKKEERKLIQIVAIATVVIVALSYYFFMS